MKKLFYSILFVAYSIIGFSQSDATFVIEGIVYDEYTGDSLENVQVFLVKDKMSIDSMFSDEAGKYRFEIFEDGCYDMRSEIPNYLSQTTDKCYEFKRGKSAKHDFYLSCYICGKIVYHRPIIDTFLIKIIIQDENGQPISDVQINLHDYYKPNNYTKIYTYLEDYLIFEVSPNITFEMALTKTGYQETERVFNFPLQMTCSQNYVETEAEYNAILKSIREREFDREMIIIMKKEN